MQATVETTGRITVHVLDTARGCGASGIGLLLFRIEDKSRKLLGRDQTDQDGRTAAPLLSGAALHPAIYEIVFDVADWAAGTSDFYDLIAVRFRVRDASQHFHVPLLLSPYGYTTYRGS